MAKAIPDIAIEVRDVSEEIAALREAVEVLEDQYAQLEGLAGAYKHLYYATFEEARAAIEAVEVLEDMYAQAEYDRDVIAPANAADCDAIADANRRLQGAVSDMQEKIKELHEDRAGLMDQVDDYAARLKATDEAYRKLSVTADFHAENVKRLRERIKTYRVALKEIASFRVDGGLANHVLNSRIDDGGSDH